MANASRSHRPVPTLLTKSYKGPKDLGWAFNTLAIHKSLAETAHRDLRDAAEDVVLAARRKQGILIVQIVKIQALVRMFIVREKHLRQLRTLRLVRAESDFIRDARTIDMAAVHATVIQRHVRGFLLRRRVGTFLIAVVKLQAKMRTFLVRIRWIRTKSALALQSWWRGALVRYLISALKVSVISLQAAARQRRARFAYCLTKLETAKIQASMRSFLVRNKLLAAMKSQAARFRNQILVLWQHASTPFAYRTQLWHFLEQETFLGFRLIIDEMDRLCENLDLHVPEHEGLIARSQEILDAEELGFPTKLEWKYVRVRTSFVGRQYQVFVFAHRTPHRYRR